MPNPISPAEAQAAYAEALKRIEKAEQEQATKLDLYDLPLTELPPEIGRLIHLKKLRLGYIFDSKAHLKKLPPEIGKLTKLEELDFSNNNFVLLPPEIGNLANLQELELRQNDLSQLPQEIGKLSKLRVLGLMGNNLTQLPSEIGKLSNLARLDVRLNHLSKLPPEIGKLSSLLELDLRQNQLNQLPYEVSKLSNLVSLRLSHNHLSQLPNGFGNLSNLQRLSLNQNNLRQLSSEVGNLTQLRSLYINENNLCQLPPEIGNLTNFHTLDLRQNSLSQLPSEISRLTTLRVFDLRQNNLNQLPPEIGNLRNLKELDLSQNELDQLPSEIGKLTRLTKLYISQNSLTRLPIEFGNLTNLVELSLRQNNLAQLPVKFKTFTKLTFLDLMDNHKLLLPPEITNQVFQPQIILEFWANKASQPHQPLNEAKFILVGQGGVGKTSLVQRLLHDKHDPIEAQTKGIDINRHMIPVPRGEETAEIQLNIWDFGGQEIMHATHQFFLTKRSLYLLVLDARQGEQEGRVEYWLALIRSFAADSPILIVINKSDEHYLELNRKALHEKYPSIVGFVHTSARTGDGMDNLKQKITNILAEMDHIDTPFPQNWIEIKNELEKLQETENFLPYYEYKKLCQKHEIANDSSQRILINFLHDLGVLLNFQDDDRVRDTNILNPQWVTQGVYDLLNAQTLAEQDGILRREQLPDLLDKNEYPLEMHRFILQMMEKFELAFPFDGANEYLVPDLLPVEEPEFDWNKIDALNFEYHYAVLPHSILHRAIVRQHTRIHDGIAWRTGVILAHDNMQALIKADVEDKTITISILGNGRRREFLSMLRFTFDSLHESITGTKPTEQVPIPDTPGVVVPYNHLLKLEEKGIREQIFPGMDDFVDVRDLLGNIEDPSRRQLQGLTRQELYRLFKEHFNLDEMQELCFLLNIEYENLGGDTQMRKAMGLIGTMERNGRLPQLIEALLELRPFLLEELQHRRPNVYR